MQIVYANPKRRRKKRKVKGPVFEKPAPKPFVPLKSAGPTNTRFEMDKTKSIPSAKFTGAPCERRSIMDAVSLMKESPEVREEIIRKSKRITITVNKGAYQYVGDDEDAVRMGRRRD